MQYNEKFLASPALLGVSQKLICQAIRLIETAYNDAGGAWPAADEWLLEAKAIMSLSNNARSSDAGKQG